MPRIHPNTDLLVPQRFGMQWGSQGMRSDDDHSVILIVTISDDDGHHWSRYAIGWPEPAKPYHWVTIWMLLPSNKSLQILPRSLHITVSNAFESSWHCLSSSPTCSSSNLLGNHRLHSFQNLTQKVDVQQEEKICKAQNFYFMLLSTNLSSQPPPNNQLWPSDWLKIY